jgi:uncharacterized protein DUF2330
MGTSAARRVLLFGAGVVGLGMLVSQAGAACCYFSAKNADVLQPGQKVFITWEPDEGMESFTVQPRFEGNALDFGMVIPTPSQPKLHEMPREFFRDLAIYSILKRREFARSKLLPMPSRGFGGGSKSKAAKGGGGKDDFQDLPRPAAVKVLEAGIVGNLDYKIIEAGRADDLFQWLKDNKYNYAGDQATLNFYIQKKWLFTVMKIDTMQMKKNKDGSYVGEVTPTQFKFKSDKLIYPLKITQISVKDKTEALFYVQAPFKVDLSGDMSYQHTWVPMLLSGKGRYRSGLPGRGSEWLEAIQDQIPGLLARNRELGFNFIKNRRPKPNQQGHIATTMEWARRLTADDIKILRGQVPYTDKVPNVDEGFTRADLKDPEKAQAIYKVIRERLAKSRREKPNGYLVRQVPEEDIRKLNELLGHMHAGRFITKFRKIFARDEMNDDLTIVQARFGQREDFSEYEEILPSSPP